MKKNRKIKVSWSALDLWRECPHKFNLYYLEEKGFRLDEKKDRFFSIVGSVLQEVFSRFYNDQLWRLRKKTIKHILEEVLPIVWKSVLRSITVEWKNHSESEEDLYKIVEEAIPKIVKLLIQKNLLKPGAYQRAEVKHTIKLIDDFYLTGRIDFLFELDDIVFIYDGKATHNINYDQLYFYVYLYELIHKKLPDKIGIIYYDTFEVDTFDINLKELNRLKLEISRMITEIKIDRLLALPEESKCSRCILNQICTKKEKEDAKI